MEAFKLLFLISAFIIVLVAGRSRFRTEEYEPSVAYPEAGYKSFYSMEPQRSVYWGRKDVKNAQYEAHTSRNQYYQNHDDSSFDFDDSHHSEEVAVNKIYKQSYYH